MAAISSLGIGSGVLTADVIDQLKAADEAAIVKPIDSKITLNTQKQDAYTLLSSLMTTFGASASSLSDGVIFENKTVDVSGEAEVSLDLGVNIDSFTLETTTLATKDVTKFGSFNNKDATAVATDSGVLTINGKEINYTASMKLQDLAQAITDAGGDSFSASILQTGSASFSLVVSSKETGIDNALTIADTTGLLDAALLNPYDETTNPNGFQKVQTAGDAVFKYNGISMTRSTNNISDIINGLNLTLRKEGDVSNVSIKLDKTAITDEMDNFVTAYNELLSNLSDMTTVNQDAGTQGVFNSDSFIKSISRELSKVVATFQNGNSLVNFGIDIDRYGVMSFNKSTLESKLNTDVEGVKLFFAGSYDDNGNATNGIFDTINDKVVGYTGYGNLFTTYEDGLKTEGTNLAKNKLSAEEALTLRYETMAARFAAYDTIINQITSSFASLQMTIDSASSSS
jgi:flagellar hook-associated protein 2